MSRTADQLICTKSFTMRKCKTISSALQQQHAIQTMKQQPYAVAQQVKWALPNELGTNVICLSSFSQPVLFLLHFWGDAGLLVSDVYAACTANQMLAGKQFNHAFISADFSI